MLPNNDGLMPDFVFEELPTNTYRLNEIKENITGFTDELQAMAQAIYLILNIERYENLIYSWNYGVEFADLFGQPIALCIPEIKRRITEALMQDTRITGVDSFEFDILQKGAVHVTFTAHTIFGDAASEATVSV
jgi:hypothetical protein